jgi:hypothetical protein
MANQLSRSQQLRRAMNAMLIALATIAPVAQSSAAPEPVTAQSKGAANPCAPTNPCAPKKKAKKPVDVPGTPEPTVPAKKTPPVINH